MMNEQWERGWGHSVVALSKSTSRSFSDRNTVVVQNTRYRPTSICDADGLCAIGRAGRAAVRAAKRAATDHMRPTNPA